MPSGHRILLGVTGGIAAVKAPDLVRRLREHGHEVRCALSRHAPSFVAPLSLEVLTGHPVYGEEYLTANGSGEELHLTAARWAELLCVAPATCHTLARLALGLADDFLTTTALAFEGPLVLAPAMDSAMWSHRATQQNVSTLLARGAHLAGPVVGPLASGEQGIGRMEEPVAIAQVVDEALSGGDLSGKTVLVSAGPTREPIDPVRFLSNRSSGKMGFALAAEAARRGARALLVAGPVALPTPRGVERCDVVTAAEMERAVHELAPDADLVIMAAAVADFRPRRVADRKLKKRDGLPTLELEPAPDILASLARVAPNAFKVGFAAETGDLEREARAKLESKGADLLIANDVSQPGIGFDSDDNEVRVLRPGREAIALERQPKRRLARRIFDLLVDELRERDESPVAGGR